MTCPEFYSLNQTRRAVMRPKIIDAEWKEINVIGYDPPKEINVIGYDPPAANESDIIFQGTRRNLVRATVIIALGLALIGVAIWLWIGLHP